MKLSSPTTILGILTGLNAMIAPIAAWPPLLAGAQVDRPTSLTPQTGSRLGDQVFLNGRAFRGRWMQWQQGVRTRIGISEAALNQLFGVEWLNTSDPQNQPVQWFTPANQANPLLPTRLVQGMRYLDVTDWLAAQGGQWSLGSDKLQIQTRPAAVVAIRQGSQSWGDRLVVELDQPTPWQSDDPLATTTLTIDATVDATTLSAFQAKPGKYIQNLVVERVGNQVRLRWQGSGRSRLWTTTNPYRLVLDVRPDAMPERQITWAPGVVWHQRWVSLNNQVYPVVWLQVNPRQPGLSLQPMWANPAAMVGIAPLSQIARQTPAIAAINAGFFNRNNQLPLGAIRRQDRWHSGPILGRGAIGWLPSGAIKFDRLTVQETVTTSSGQRFNLTHLNSGYVQAGIARYTSEWGPTYSRLTDSEIVVTVRRDQVVAQQPLNVAGQSSIAIPVDGYLLVLRSQQSAAATFPPGISLQLTSQLLPPDAQQYHHWVAAGPLLLRDRQIVLDAALEKFSPAFMRERASRSAIGRTPEGHLLLVAAHPSPIGVGLSLMDMAQLMQQLGAIDALNLDGGSSTSLYLGERLLDRPARTAARVHNGIGIFWQPLP